MNFKTYLKNYPATIIITLITIVVFVVEIIMGGSNNTAVLYKLGALTKEGVVNGEWWRLFNPIFLHLGFEHILFNMLSLIILGFYIEPFLGSFRFLIIYIFGGIYGNLFSFAFQSPNEISVGASSSIFAILGVFILLRRSIVNHVQYSNFSRQIFLLAIINVVIDVISNLSGGAINILAHAGGFLGGYLLSVCVGSRYAKNFSLFERVIAFLIYLISAVSLLYIGVRSVNG